MADESYTCEAYCVKCKEKREFTGVIVVPQLPNLSLSYGGKFKEIDASFHQCEHKVGAGT